jgi:hypothetical protein
MDAWDKKKTDQPWAGRPGGHKPKATDMEFLALKYVGVIVHGHGRLMFYVDHSVSEGDADLTVEVIRRTLLWMESKNLFTGEPKPIHWQFDNASDNKNKVVDAALEFMAEQPWFTEVTANFLIASHTHEDIDQWFSIPSMVLYATPAPTIPILNTVIAGSFRGNATELSPDLIEHIPAVPAYREWMEPHIDPHFGGTKRRDCPIHVMRFKRPSPGEPVEMHYKLLSTDAYWRPSVLEQDLNWAGNTSALQVNLGACFIQPGEPK